MRKIRTANGSRTRPQRRAAPRLQRFSDHIFTRLARKTRFMEPSLAARWQEIVGPEIADLCWPTRLLPDRQLLEVVTRNGAAATRLQYETPQIIAALAPVLGPGTVTRLHIRQQASPAKADHGEQIEDSNPDPDTSQPSPLERVVAKYRASLEDK